MPRELASPWRLRWEGRRQLQLPKEKKVGQNFPSSRQINKLAACPVDGPRASVLPIFLPATREGAPKTDRCPANLSQSCQGTAGMVRAAGSRFSTKARARALGLPLPGQPPQGAALAPSIAGSQPASVKARFPCPCRIWLSDPPRNRVGKGSSHVIHFTHGGAPE